MTCDHTPPEGQKCTAEATRSAVFRLRNSGWTRSMLVCDEHAALAELQGAVIEDHLGPVSAHYQKPVRRRKK